MTRIDDIEKNNTTQVKKEPVFSTLHLVNTLENIGFIVIPLIDVREKWNPMQFHLVADSCQKCTRDKPAFAGSVLWLDLEGIILDFQCEKDQNSTAIEELISQYFGHFEIESKQVNFKNNIKCLRFFMSIHSRDVG